jgi:hypothetical protein
MLDIAQEHCLLSSQELQLRIRLKEQIHTLTLIQEIRWQQRNSIRWLKLEDKNTRYFHMRASSKTKRNFIHQISTQTENFTSTNEILTAFTEHYKAILGSNCNDLQDFTLKMFGTSFMISTHSLILSLKRRSKRLFFHWQRVRLWTLQVSSII